MQPAIPYDLPANLIRKKSNIKWYKARWLLPLTFVGGYITTFSIFEPVVFEYLSLTIFSVLACSLLLSRLNPPLVNKLPVWIILGIFIVAYYLKFYLMIWEPDIMPINFSRRFYWIINSPDILIDTYAIMTYGFVSFCLTAVWLLVYVNIPRFQPSKRKFNYGKIIPKLSILILLLGIGTISIMYITGIARKGVEVHLPFRLAGWIVNVHRTLIPALLLLLIWSSDKTRWQRHSSFGVSLLFMYGLSDMLLRSSRGALLGMFIKLTMLFIVTGQMTKQRVRLFEVVLLITVLLWPVISVYRGITAGRESLSIGASLAEAVSTISSFSSIPLAGMLGEAAKSVFFRFTGVDILLTIVGSGVQPMGTSVFNPSVTKFVTVEIFGFPPDAPMGIGPSLLGWFYIVGGKCFVVVGMFCLVFLTWITWRTLSKARLRCQPIAQVLFLSWIISVFSGGALDSQFLPVMVMIGAVAVCEWIMRTVGTASVSKNVGISGSKELRDASGVM